MLAAARLESASEKETTDAPSDPARRAGANESTTFQVSADVEVEGRKLPAGTYSLHMIPGRTEWTIIFNRNAKLWGSYDYKPEDDVLRVKVKPQPAEMHERLTYAVTPVSMEASAVMMGWEKLKVSFAVKTDAKSAGEKALASVATMPRKPPADVVDEFRKTVAGWK